MATKMTKQSYIEYIETMMGASLVELENKDDLDKIVQLSLEELKEYLSMPKFVTVPYQNRIDLSQYKVRSILQVYRDAAADTVSGTAGSTDAFLLAVGMVQGVPYDLTRYANLMQVRKIKNTISTDLDYRWDDPYLYIIQNPMQSSMITIEYTPEISSVEEITDDYWIGKLKKLCLANEKIILGGRIRNKYTLTNALYKNDGDILLQEGKEEKNALLAFLEENSDLILPIGS